MDFRNIGGDSSIHNFQSDLRGILNRDLSSGVNSASADIEIQNRFPQFENNAQRSVGWPCEAILPRRISAFEHLIES